MIFRFFWQAADKKKKKKKKKAGLQHRHYRESSKSFESTVSPLRTGNLTPKENRPASSSLTAPAASRIEGEGGGGGSGGIGGGEGGG